MEKIGRNDSCYCGSGKKYKNCCLNSKPSGFYILPSGKSVGTYAEDDVVKQLISSSSAFKDFYETERESIGEIHWIKSNKDVESILGFRKGQKGKMYYLTGKTGLKKLIVLDQIPPSLDDEFIIAHEMGHFLIFNKYFPGVGPYLPNGLENNEKNERIRLASSMSTMIHDPLCNSLLKKYGISYGNMYRDHILSVLNWKNVEEPAPNTYSAHTFVFEYVLSNLHDAMIISERDCLEKYNKFFESKFPSITEEGKFILDLIEIYGYDTPEKLTFLYQDIINSMELGAVCKLEVPLHP